MVVNNGLCQVLRMGGTTSNAGVTVAILEDVWEVVVGPLPTVLTTNHSASGGDLVATGALPLLLVPTPATKKVRAATGTRGARTGTKHHGVFDGIYALVFPCTFAAIEGAQRVQEASLVRFGAPLPLRDGFERHCGLGKVKG